MIVSERVANGGDVINAVSYGMKEVRILHVDAREDFDLPVDIVNLLILQIFVRGVITATRQTRYRHAGSMWWVFLFRGYGCC